MAIDRNQKSRDEFAAARQRKQFVDAVNTGQASLHDRFGKRITAGATVLYLPPPTGLMYQVADVQPVLDPGAPAGLLRLTLVMTAPFPAGQPLAGLFVLQAGGAAAAETAAPLPLSGIPDDGLASTGPPDDGYRAQPREDDSAGGVPSPHPLPSLDPSVSEE